MKKHYATEVDRIIAGIQSRTVSRRNMIAENEQHYGMLRAIAKSDPESEESKQAGKNGKLLRKALNAVGKDQRLDTDTMKMLRRHQKEDRALQRFASVMNNAIVAFDIAIFSS